MNSQTLYKVRARVLFSGLVNFVPGNGSAGDRDVNFVKHRGSCGVSCALYDP